MIILLQIDKSGNRIFDQNYSIVVAKNKEIAYGINIPQKLKRDLKESMTKLKIYDEKRFILRFHTAIIIYLILKSTNTEDKLAIELCNDFDGHFHELQNMIFDNLKNKGYGLLKEDIVRAKFNKPSFIDSATKRFRSKITHTNDIIVEINIHELKELIRKK
jgi:hypothetical protein